MDQQNSRAPYMYAGVTSNLSIFNVYFIPPEQMVPTQGPYIAFTLFPSSLAGHLLGPKFTVHTSSASALLGLVATRDLRLRTIVSTDTNMREHGRIPPFAFIRNSRSEARIRPRRARTSTRLGYHAVLMHQSWKRINS